MNAFWVYFWPPIAAGLAIGLVAGLLAFRRRGRQLRARLAIGLALAVASALLWHWPLGGGGEFAARAERSIRATTVFYEIPEVSGRLQRDPLNRQVVLSGPADDFQRRELVRLMNDLPGIAATGWSSGQRRLPLFLEGAVAALGGFLCGLLVAYLVELRRRYKTRRKW